MTPDAISHQQDVLSGAYPFATHSNLGVCYLPITMQRVQQPTQECHRITLLRDLVLSFASSRDLLQEFVGTGLALEKTRVPYTLRQLRQPPDELGCRWLRSFGELRC